MKNKNNGASISLLLISIIAVIGVVLFMRPPSFAPSGAVVMAQQAIEPAGDLQVDFYDSYITDAITVQVSVEDLPTTIALSASDELGEVVCSSDFAAEVGENTFQLSCVGVYVQYVDASVSEVDYAKGARISGMTASLEAPPRGPSGFATMRRWYRTTVRRKPTTTVVKSGGSKWGPEAAPKTKSGGSKW